MARAFGEPFGTLVRARLLTACATAALAGGLAAGAPASPATAGTNAIAAPKARVAATNPPPRDDWFGPAWSTFGRVFEPGREAQAFGPLWGATESEGERFWRISPFFSKTVEPALEKEEWNLLYPVVGHRRYGTEWKLHVFQFLEFAGGNTVDDEKKERTTLFPFYFRQRSSNPTNDYLAVLPFYGHVHNRLFRSEVKFVLAPLYVQSRKRDWVTDNYLMPFFHHRHGPLVEGWQFWPVAGSERRAVSWQTNSLDELEVVPGHDKKFLLWPVGFSERLEIGGANPTTNLFVFPLYLRTRSAEQDHDWLFFVSHRTNRVAKFEEWSYPWPFLGHARGPGKAANRVFPLWGHARGGALESGFVLWPFYTHKRLRSDPLDHERHRFLYFGYDDLRQSDTSTGRAFRRRSLWPLFTWRHELDGRERLQLLAPWEPLAPANTHIERLYSPLWSVWRSESNPARKTASQSLLWNLWRRESDGGTTRAGLLFGAVRTERDAQGRRWTFFGLGGGGAARASATAAVLPAGNPLPTASHRGPELRRPRATASLAGPGNPAGPGAAGVASADAAPPSK